MPKLSSADLVDAFKDMTLSGLIDFRCQFEETFDVSGDIAAPVQILGDPPVEDDVEQTEFDVVLEAAGAQKINVIKVVRELTHLGLKDAKDWVDAAPKPVLQAVAREAADDAAERLRAVGATVSIV